MTDCDGESSGKKKKKINGCELERKWVDASEPQDVEFRCMVTDGKPCRNQKIVFISLWFSRGNIWCKWNPYYRMDRLRNKDKHHLKFAFLGATFRKKEMTVADCFTCLCSAHSFLRAGNYRGADSKQSSVTCREGLEKSHHCLHLTNITKDRWRLNKNVKKKNK